MEKQELFNQNRAEILRERNPFLPAWQVTYILLREDIIACRLQPGTNLTEKQCTELYGGSRSTVRKVFDRLLDEGWLQRGEGRHIRVIALSREEHMDLMEYRMAIEPTAARLAARGRTRSELQRIEKYAALCDTTNVNTLYVNDLKFHKAIFDACHNRFLMEAYARLDPVISRGKRYTAQSFEAYCNECFQEHMAIYEAIRSGDEGAAHQRTFQHIKMMLDAQIQITA